MPKDLRRKIVLIAVVMLFALVAVYPPQDTLMWKGRVRDTIDHGRLVDREILSDKQVMSPVVYWADKLTLGIFHHKQEKYHNSKELQSPPEQVVERDVDVYAAGMTLGLDLKGGAELRYRIETEDNELDVANKIISVIRKRIDAMGLKEPVIQREGPKRIQIQLPGTDEQEIERIKKIIESSGHLEFRLVSDNTALNRQALSGDVPEGYHLYKMRGNESSTPLLVSDNVQVTGEDIVSTSVQVNPQTRELEVALSFNGEGRQQFYKTTAANQGKRLAIILDDIRGASAAPGEYGPIKTKGTLYSAPTIDAAIMGDAVISGGRGGFKRSEAEDLVTTLKAGSLPAALVLEDENRVGPSLGQDSINAGTTAIIIGFAAVILFMLLYYRKAGIIANIALLLNLVLIVGALAIFQATLTLPGIAGIILTVGMAVDANVLIFERIREEMAKKGASQLLIAVRDGFSRAIVTIVDANLTTLGTALVLYMIGTGTIKGFAATLSLGIIFSMFTAVFVTRVVFELFIIKGWMHKLGMSRMIGETHVRFTQKARFVSMISIALIAVGLVAFGLRGKDNLDIDFSGGTMMHVVTKPGTTEDQVRQLVEEAYPKAHFQPVTSTQGEFIIKTSSRGLAEVNYEKISLLPAQGELKPFAGGNKVTVKIDKPVSVDDVKKALGSRDATGVAVYGQGQEENGAYRQFEILMKTGETAKAIDTVRNAFIDLSVKSDVARVLSNLLVPQGFTSSKVTDDGNVQIEANFKKPVSVAQLKADMQSWGYANPQVTVKGNPQATEGTAMTIVAKAKQDDPSMLRTNIEGKYKMSEPFARVRSVGPHVAGVMQQKAMIAIFLSLLFVIGYIWFRFELKFGIAAVIALIHDVAFTIGILAIFRIPFNLTVVAAILTIIGYSLNDTIVVFDRIRENLNLMRREHYDKIVDISINQTLSRTLLTSLTTLVAVLALLVFGGGVIFPFALALTIGIVVGTYSSIFIASPFVVMLQKRAERKRHAEAANSSVATAKS